MRKERIDIKTFTGPEDTLVGRIDIAEYFGVRPTTWDAWVKSGQAPKAFTYEGCFPKWRIKDVRALGKKRGMVEPSKEISPDVFAVQFAELIKQMTELTKAFKAYMQSKQ